MWEKGQKVVCVNDQFHGGVWDWGDQLPRCGQTYTIRAVGLIKDNATRIPGVAFLLEGLNNPRDRLWFAERRFKPIMARQVRLETKRADEWRASDQRQLQFQLQISIA